MYYFLLIDFFKAELLPVNFCHIKYYFLIPKDAILCVVGYLTEVIHTSFTMDIVDVQTIHEAAIGDSCKIIYNIDPIVSSSYY